MAPKPGRLAALMVGSMGHDPEAGSSARARVRAARGVLDAIRSDDETAFDAALGDWCHEYDEGGSEPEDDSDAGEDAGG